MQTNAALRHTPIELCRSAKNKRKGGRFPRRFVSCRRSDDIADMDMLRELHGANALICAEIGPLLASEHDAKLAG
jgi:hypothetical protein